VTNLPAPQKSNYLKSKVALVTGGSGAIGGAVALELARQGARVIAHYHQGEERITDLRKRADQEELHLGTCCFDLCNSQQVKEVLQQVVKQHGAIDILVNNSGITYNNLIFATPEETLEQLIATNFNGHYLCCKIAARSMLRKKWGRIINISSIVASTGNPGQTAYAASKGAVEGLTRSLALELASRNITVNTVEPGLINTGMAQGIDHESREKLIEQIPVKRAGEAREVGWLVAFLASPNAAYITGQVIGVNGGLLPHK